MASGKDIKPEIVFNNLGLPAGNVTYSIIENNVSKSGISQVYMADTGISGWSIIIALVDTAMKTLVIFNASHIVHMAWTGGSGWVRTTIV